MTHFYRLLSVENSTFKAFDSADWRIWFYLVAQLVGGVLMMLLLATMLWPTRKRKPRNPLLISLCFSWWLSAFPSLLILYYTREVTGPPPAHNVCLTSAVLTMSQTILVALTAPALIFHIWLVVQTALGSKFTSDGLVRRSILVCLIVPWTVYVVFILVSVSVGLAKPALVHRALFYCIVDDDQLTEAIGIIGTVTMLTAIILEIWTVIVLHQNRTRIQQLSREGRGLDISLVIRVILFGVYVFLGLCLNVISIIDWTNPIPDLFFSTFGIAVFTVFGTQRDIWRIWKDASRHVTSRRSGPEHPSRHSSSHPHPRLSASIPSATNRDDGKSSRHFNFSSHEPHGLTESTSKRLSFFSFGDLGTRSAQPSVPPPATIRSSTRQPRPSITIQSTPDLLHGSCSTPTTAYNSPSSDSKLSENAAWQHHLFASDIDLRNISQRSLITPPAVTPIPRLESEPVHSGEHSYPPSSADLRSWVSSSRYDDSRSTLNVPPVVVRGDSPVVWDPDVRREDGDEA